MTISETPTTRNTTLGQGVYNSTGDRIEARLRTTGTGLNGTPATQTAAGTLDATLQHVVFTPDSSGATTVYVDGVSVQTGTASGNMSGWDTSFELALAAELDESRYWHGTYHLVAIYDQALSASDVTQNFAAGADPTSGGGGGGGGPTTSTTTYYAFAGKTIGFGDANGFTIVATGHLGSTEATIDGQTGVAARQTYTPFGAVRSGVNNELGTDRTFTGHIDDGTGLLHYRARQYDPVLARFAQADNSTVDGLNRFTYVQNNPLKFVDIEGTDISYAFRGTAAHFLIAAFFHAISTEWLSEKWVSNTRKKADIVRFQTGDLFEIKSVDEGAKKAREAAQGYVRIYDPKLAKSCRTIKCAEKLKLASPDLLGGDSVRHTISVEVGSATFELTFWSPEDGVILYEWTDSDRVLTKAWTTFERAIEERRNAMNGDEIDLVFDGDDGDDIDVVFDGQSDLGLMGLLWRSELRKAQGYDDRSWFTKAIHGAAGLGAGVTIGVMSVVSALVGGGGGKFQ